jgi:hypothetical protein
MFFWAVLGVNCVYLIAELLFNSQLIDIASFNSTPEQIENIEVFGRSLSTIGFSLLFVKLILISPFAKNVKIFLWVVTLLLAHPIFFIGQKELINHFADSASYSQKESYYNTFLVKKAMLGEADHDKKMIFFDDSNSISSKVFFSSMGVTKNYSSIINLYENDINMIEYAAISDSRQISNKIFNTYSEFGSDNQIMYNQYSKIQNKYRNDISLIKGSALDNYERYTSEKGRNIVFDQYERVNKNIKKAYNYAVKKMPEEIKSTAWYVGKCTTMDCLNQKIKDFRKTQVDISKNYLKSKADTLPTFDFYEFCSFSGNNKPNSTTFMTTIVNGKKNTQRSRNLLINTGMNKPNMSCKFNLDSLSNIYGKHYKEMIRKNTSITNFNIDDVDTFSNSSEFRNIIIQMAKNEGLELNLPRNWHYSDKKTFINNATKDYTGSIKKQYEEAMIKKIGIRIPLNLTKVEFINGPYLQKMINDEIEIDYGIRVNENNADDFFSNNKKKLINISGTNLLKIDIDSQGGDIIKAMIIPSIAMFLSLIFFLLNGILLTRDILLKFIDRKKCNLIILFGALLIFIAPFFIPNFDEGHALFINDLRDNSFWVSVAYDWTLSWEKVLYPIGEFINNTLQPLLSKYINSNTIDAVLN